MRAFAAAALAVLTAAILAACGSSSSTTTGNAGGQTSTTKQATTVTRTATRTATASASTTTPASSGGGSAPCRAGGMTLAFLGGQGATGHGLLGFALHNTGTSSCNTVGYPGIQFLERSGGDLPTKPIHTTHDFFGTVPLRALVVPAGGTVSFRLGVTHGSGSTAGCTTAYALQVIPPNDTHTLHVSMPQGEYECTTATVSPLAPGTSAYH